MKKLLLLFMGCSILVLNHAQTPFSITSSGSVVFTSLPPQVITANYINVGSTTYQIHNSAQISHKAVKEIHVHPGYEVSGLVNTGFAELYIDDNLLDIASFHLNGFNNIPKYDKFEIGVVVPESIQQSINGFIANPSNVNTTNPYDPSKIRVKCTYLNTSTNNTFVREGFYYRDFEIQNNLWVENLNEYTFRVRFAPPENGLYNCKVEIFLGGNLSSYYSNFSFNVVSSSNPGHLSMAPNNLLKLRFDNGDMYFGVGQNIPSLLFNPVGCNNCANNYPPKHPPSDYSIFRGYLSNLSSNQGNFVRIRLDALAGFPVEWGDEPIFSNESVQYTLAECLNNYNQNQRQLWELDQIISQCETDGLYIILNLLGDGEWNSNTVWGITNPWGRNPYSTLLGNNSSGVQSFFSNPQAMDIYKKQLQYIANRWGYSTNIAIWELINETNNLDGISTVNNNPYQVNPTFKQNVDTWICTMKSFIENIYPTHPITTGYAGVGAPSNMPSCLNIWSGNNYSSGINNNTFSEGNFFSRAPDAAPFHSQGKPFVFGEIGATVIDIIDRNSDKEFHNAIWATTMMGGISTGLYWNDPFQVNNVNHRQNFNSLSEFTKRVDWTQYLTPGRRGEAGGNSCQSGGVDREVGTFWQRNGAKNYIIGWTMNRSSIWANDVSSFSVSDYNAAKTQAQWNGSSNPYTIFTTNCNPQIAIDNLLATTKYRIKIYDTYASNNQELDNFTEWSNALGTLKFRRQMPFANANPFYPDYAFIIVTENPRPGGGSQIEPGIIEFDTIQFYSSQTICLDEFRHIMDENYSYLWKVNNVEHSKEKFICLEELQNQSFSVSFEATNDQNVVFIKKYELINVDITPNSEQLYVYPNPSNGEINIWNTLEKENLEIIILDVTGKVIFEKTEQTNNHKCQLSVPLSQSFYLIEIKNSSGQIFRNKLIISK